MNDGGPAFPRDYHHSPESPGMSLLDYLAAQAMAALLSQVDHNGAGYPEPRWNGNSEDRDKLAYRSYALAEAMLRQKKIIAADKPEKGGCVMDEKLCPICLHELPPKMLSLIAGARALLEICEEIDAADVDTYGLGAYRDKLRDAIAKAKGGA
jgi:hypothetical protein